MKFLPLRIILFLLVPIIGKSQGVDSVNFVSDRPGIATPPDILNIKTFQIEDGLQYENSYDGEKRNENFLITSLLFRNCVAKNIEVRLQTDYAYNKETEISATTSTYGLNPITIGSKFKLVEHRKILPDISILANFTLPYMGLKESRPDNIAPSFYLLMSNPISDQFNVCYNYGLSWDGKSSFPTHFYALCLGINLNQKLSIFFENYGFISQVTKPAFYTDTGIAYLINKHFQIDLSGAASLNSFTDYYLLNTGFAWKI